MASIDMLHALLAGYAVALTAGIYSLAKGYEGLSVVATHIARLSTDVECAAGMLERGKTHEAFIKLKGINDELKGK